MESLKILFPVSGVETYFFLPPILMFVISFFTSISGLSGAFLLLPLNMSLLGFTSISVTSTNFFYNAIGIPGGVARFIKEKRLLWPLAGFMVAGTLPGVLIGYFLRARYLPDPRVFKFFVGLVLLFMAGRLLWTVWSNRKENCKPPAEKCVIKDFVWDLKQISYSFLGKQVRVNVPFLLVFSFFVGIIGGIYGIGGGALLVPVLVGFFGVPVYTLAGASLFGTFVTSVAGVIIYAIVPLNGQTAPPDWLLGFLYGIGGLAGMSLGARCQRYVPEHLIKGLLGLILVSISGRYIWQFFG
jgi:uncharacterized membrane protein YfcA